MNVLSLFDGMSCGQIALERAGIPYNDYYASEIDKNCIAVTQSNYPNTIQLGDVTDIHCGATKIDLLLAGSPCQGFSIGGNGLNFHHPKSALFFEFVRLLKSIQPTYFLLENVPMRKEWKDIISEYVGRAVGSDVQPTTINSSLVSAQNRQRLYWTNIPHDIPRAKKLILKDVLEEDNEWIYDDGIIEMETRRTRGPIRVGGLNNGNPNSQGERIYSIHGKSPTLSANSGGTAGVGNCLITDDISKKRYRRLMVCEAERLQTVPVDYTRKTSRTQAHKMLGNGWTIDVVVSILEGIK